jgi:hypothetical protein
MHIKKRKGRRVVPLLARSRMVIRESDKVTGEVEREMGPFYNTIHAEGFDGFLNMIAGVDTNVLSAAGSSLKLTNTLHGGKVSGAPNFVSGADGIFVPTLTKSAPAVARMWQWDDDSTATYDPNYAELWVGMWNEGLPTFEYEFCHIDISAAGSKPSNKNWHYQIILELYSTDTDLTTAGLNRMIEIMVGGSTDYFTGANTKLRPMSDGSTELSGTDQAADANPTVNTTDNEISWTWTVADGDFEGTWARTRVKHAAPSSFNVRDGGCKTDGSSCGVKASGEEWEYTWVFSIAQGS